MRWSEIMAEAEPEPTGSGAPPLTPKQARARKEKRDKADAHVQDVQAANALRLAAARRKVARA